jgi:MFS family permease
MGWWSDRFGRRWAIIIPALIAPLYLLSENFLWIAVGFILQGMCAGGGMQGQMVPYLNERSRPRYGRPRALSATTRRSSVASCRWC